MLQRFVQTQFVKHSYNSLHPTNDHFRRACLPVMICCSSYSSSVMFPFGPDDDAVAVCFALAFRGVGLKLFRISWL